MITSTTPELPGRQIATLRRAAGLSLPIALMTPPAH